MLLSSAVQGSCYEVQRGLQLPKSLRQGLATVCTSASVNVHSHLLQIEDNCSKIKFLVDSGSQVCVMPRELVNLSELNTNNNIQLKAANSTSITVYGTAVVNLNLGFNRIYPWTFYVANVSMPIIGADFLIHFEIIPSHRR